MYPVQSGRHGLKSSYYFIFLKKCGYKSISTAEQRSNLHYDIILIIFNCLITQSTNKRSFKPTTLKTFY